MYMLQMIGNKEEIGLLDEAVNKIMKDDNDNIIPFVHVS